MRIVLFRSNPIDPDSRVEKEVESLTKHGFFVTLFVWDRSQGGKRIVDFKRIGEFNVKRIRIMARAKYGAGLKSFFPFLKFQLSIFFWVIFHKKEFDVCHFCDFDTAMLGRIATRIARKPYVFDIFDYMSTNPNSFLKRMVKRMEDKTINRASATIICSDQRIQQIKGTNPKKVVVVHNSPKMPDSFNNVIKTKTNKIKIVYVGILDEKQRMIKEIVNIVERTNNLELHIGGFGPLESFVLERAKISNNILFYGKLSYLDTLSLERECDIITAIYNPNVANSIFAAPNKFYEALMLGKPTIMIKGTGMSDVVEREQIGVVTSCDEESIERGIKELISKKPEWEKIRYKENELYTNMFSWTEMERRLVLLYREIEEKSIEGAN